LKLILAGRPKMGKSAFLSYYPLKQGLKRISTITLPS